MPDYVQERSFDAAIAPSGMLDTAVEWMKYNLNPGDVFDDDDLEKWAEDNGYVKEAPDAQDE